MFSSQASVDFFPICSKLAYIPFGQREKSIKLEPGTFRSAVACSTDCVILKKKRTINWLSSLPICSTEGVAQNLKTTLDKHLSWAVKN